ncbi:MAG: UDP-glucose dehydrogenase family protein [Candidatus Bathyarchaeia archaeon]
MHDMEDTVCVVGLWHLGCTYAACLAEIGYRVIGVDENPDVIRKLNEGRAPLFEPGLDDLIFKGLHSGNLTFQTEIKTAANNAGIVIIAYDTPIDEHDRVDISIVLRTAEQLKDLHMQGILVVSSQVPAGTCEQLTKILHGSISIACVPENLRLGEAIKRFMKPDMIVIGADNQTVISQVRRLFSPIKTKIVEMDLRSAEMTKHALNSFLATSISFANEIGNICDLIGADALKIATALKSDSRIGAKALIRPGLGFAGGTLARDLRTLQKLSRDRGHNTPLIDSVLSVNEEQNRSIVEKLKQLTGPLNGKTIGVLGLTYKAGTSTLRRSAAVEIVRHLKEEGATVNAYDPHVSVQEGAMLGINMSIDPYASCINSDALLIVNDMPEFTNLDFSKIRKVMKTPLVFDAQNLVDPEKVTASGMKYFGIGRGMKH